MQSESLKELTAALSKAQGVMEGAKKDSANPFFRSKYADLASVWDSCRKPLSDNGLAVVQTTDIIPEGLRLITTLLHVSGEWVSGVLPVKPVKDDPQGLGSAMTYTRRYGLMAMVGIAPEDDDGNAASGKKQEEKQAVKTSETIAVDDLKEFETLKKSIADSKTIRGLAKGTLESIHTTMLKSLDEGKISQISYESLYKILQERKVALTPAPEGK